MSTSSGIWIFNHATNSILPPIPPSKIRTAQRRRVLKAGGSKFGPTGGDGARMQWRSTNPATDHDVRSLWGWMGTVVHFQEGIGLTIFQDIAAYTPTMRLRALDFDSTYLAWGRETTGVDAWARVSPPRQELNKSGVKVTHFRIACASNATPSHSPKRSLRLVNVLKLDGVHWKDMTGFETMRERMRCKGWSSGGVASNGSDVSTCPRIQVNRKGHTYERQGAGRVLATCTYAFRNMTVSKIDLIELDERVARNNEEESKL
ncbi:hypothetical protein DFP72DRAFT_844703 [Ephemerocybe angulata]|uniref:Uncharacterized protein n=1 Tax=Ephemerocybe angulata TaxID=980116 RepID=A0A8H6MCC2_9AGAR|nr:hypothetical protein DFP72DRAFT_844703 [Tulosesus angulatus]